MGMGFLGNNALYRLNDATGKYLLMNLTGFWGEHAGSDCVITSLTSNNNGGALAAGSFCDVSQHWRLSSELVD